MEDHAFAGLSLVHGKIYGQYGQQNAKQKISGCCQKNLDHGETNKFLTIVQTVFHNYRTAVGNFTWLLYTVIQNRLVKKFSSRKTKIFFTECSRLQLISLTFEGRF
jgi:hypothetical protein